MRKRLSLTAAIITVSLVSTPMVSPFWSYNPAGPVNFDYHAKMTKDAIGNEFVDSGTLKRIHQANRDCDLGANYFIQALHFDSEAFEQGCLRLAQNLNDALRLLSECKKTQAIEKFGEALHALQDFYSHSNWVELNLNFDPSLIPSAIPVFENLVTLGPNGIFVAGSLQADTEAIDTCTASPFGGAPTSVVQSGYDPPIPRPLGKCTHLEVNKDGPDAYVPPRPQASSPRGAFVVNNNKLHEFAKNVALRHTKQVWGNDGSLNPQGIKQALKLRFGEEQGTEYYNLLVKPQARVGFNIDVTGSMGSALAIVKPRINAWVDHLEELTTSPHLTLVIFKDWIVFEDTTCFPGDFLDWVYALNADGGDDCPEASLTGAMAAAERVGEGGTIILATDAAPRENAATFEELKKLLVEKKIKCHTIWKDECDCHNPYCGLEQGAGGGTAAGTLTGEEVYPVLAEISGGLSLPFDEMEKALDLILESINKSLVDGSGSGIDILCGGWNEPLLVNVPVDADLASIDFIVTSEPGSNVLLEVLRPDGSPVQPTDPDATFFSGTGLQVVGVTGPAPGIWTMRITGTGSFKYYVRGIGDTAIFDVTFLRMEEVEGESPLISIIDGPLQLCEPVLVQIDMIGPLPALTFDLVRPDGSVIEPLNVSPDELGLGVYSGLYTPTQLIDRFYVRARDAAGGPFQRVLRRGFETYTETAYVDCNCNGLADTTEIAEELVPDCNTNAIPDECDIAWGASDDFNSNEVPDECEPPLVIVWNDNPLSIDRTTRSLRFRVDSAATGTPLHGAIKVTMVDLQHPVPPNLPQFPPPDFSAFESATCTALGESIGCARWVGKPATFYESQGPPLYIPYRASRLQCTPVYWDWVTETATSLITVVGAEIIPSSEYSVRAYSTSCIGAEASCTNVSDPVTMYTRRFGDVDEDYNPPSAMNQPNAIDVAQVINKFKNVMGAPVHARAQLQPNLPELNASVYALDIVAVVDAVRGLAYAFPGPCPCPSAVTCNSRSCSNEGACVDIAPNINGICIKTCVDGSNDSEPCINNPHCPGGCCGSGCDSVTVGGGFCRDRCARCTP